MRDILTILAVLLVVVLSAALAVPYLVNWDAERSLVEAQLSKLLGQQVKIRGGIDLKLLPTPYLQLADLEVADPATGSDIRADELHLEIALPPLMRGEVDFVEALLVRPRLRLRIEDNAITLPLTVRGVSEQMQFDRISVEDGSLAIDDPATGRNFAFTNVALSAEARALSGPLTAHGTFEVAGEPTTFQLSTGARQGDRLHFKLIVDESARYPGVDLDANLLFAPPALPSIDGTVRLSGHQREILALPWQLSGALHAELRKVSIAKLDLRLGDEDRATNLDGAATFDLGSKPRLDLALKAQQADLDKLLTGKTGPRPMQRLAAALGRALKSENFAGLPFRLRCSADSVLLGGANLTRVAANLAVSGKGPIAVSFKAEGPGLSRLAADGSLEAGIAPQFTGHIDASADDVRRLEEWLAANLPQSGLADAMPLGSFAVVANATISPVGFVGSDLSLRVNGSTLAGTVAYTKAIGPDPARFFADLTAPALELDSLPDFSALARRTRAMDLALRLDAHAVRLSQTQAGEIDVGQIVLKFDRTGSDSKLENLAVNGIDGADLTASGHWDGHAGDVAVKLDAERLDGLVGMARRFVPGSALAFLTDRAMLFSPAHLNLGAEVNMSGDTFGFKALNVAGTAGDTTISGKANPDPANPAAFNLSLRFDAKDSTALLEQIGVPTLPLQDTGPGSIEISAHGSGHLELNAAASLAGADFTFRGSVDPSLSAPHATGTATLKSADLSGLVRITALGLPDLASHLPVELSATLDAGSNAIALDNLVGTLAGSKIAGRFAYRADKGIDGAITADSMSLSDLLALALGPQQQIKPGALWSDANFAAPEINPPPAHLAMRVANFAVWPQIDGRDARFDLAISGTAAGLEFGVHHLAMQLGTGDAGADLTLRRHGSNAAAEVHLALHRCAIALPSARGLLSADLDLAGTGDSAAALAAGFAGSGTLSFDNLVLPDTDPGALGRVFESVEEDQLGIDEAEIDRVLLAEFGKQSLALGKLSFDAGLAGGVLRLSQKDGGARIEPGITARLGASLDVRDLTIDQESALDLVRLPRNWSGAPPQVTLAWQGSISNPTQTINAAGFVNALAARAIARESARIEAQEFDVYEHAFFIDRLDFERRRQAERLKLAEYLRNAAEVEALDKTEAQRTEADAEATKRKSQETIHNAAQIPVQIGQPAPLPPARPDAAPSSAGTTVFPDPTAAGRY